MHEVVLVLVCIAGSTVCEFSIGPGTNASGILVGPMESEILFKQIDYSGKLPSGPVKTIPNSQPV